MNKAYIHACGKKYLVREMIKEHDDWYRVVVCKDLSLQYWVSLSYKKSVKFTNKTGWYISIPTAYNMVNENA